MAFGKIILTIILLILYAINFRIHGFKLQHWNTKQDNCTVSASRCVHIPKHMNGSCLGNLLPYELTTENPLTEDVPFFSLRIWSVMKAVPMCWDKLQFFLCAVYVPECRERHSLELTPSVHRDSRPERSGSARSLGGADTPETPVGVRVVLPEAEMCLAVKKACPLLFSMLLEWEGTGDVSGQPLVSTTDNLLGSPNRPNSDIPAAIIPQFLHCRNYVHGCRQNKLTAGIFRIGRGNCQPPLVSTTNRRNWIKRIDTCSFPCRRPHFQPEDYAMARRLTSCASILCSLLNIFVLVTLYLLRSARGGVTEVKASPSTCPRLAYTALVHIHVFFLIGCLGWLLPHLPGIGDSVACRDDGSVRVGEPQTMSGRSALCVVDFVLVYFPLIATALWSNLFDYAIHKRLRSLLQEAGAHSASLETGPPSDVTPPHSILPPADDTSAPKQCRKDESAGQSRTALTPGVEVVEEKSACYHLTCRLLWPLERPALAHSSGLRTETVSGTARTPDLPRIRTFEAASSTPQLTCVHLFLFALPLVFTLVGLTASEIDGEPLSGTCFVGSTSVWARSALVFLPLTSCLLLKILYLGRSMSCLHCLGGCFSNSPFHLDRAFGHRLHFCARAYGIFLGIIFTLWTFSCAVHIYTYIGEPYWIESQRLLLLCQLRHQLMGFDPEVASAACLGVQASVSPLAFGSLQRGSGRFSHLQPLLTATTNTNTAAAAAAASETNASLSEAPHTLTDGLVWQPVASPILLNLLTFFALNLLFSSLSLLDISVKRSWSSLWRRLLARFSCKTVARQPSSQEPHCLLHEPDLACPSNTHLPVSFSWWDPGLFLWVQGPPFTSMGDRDSPGIAEEKVRLPNFESECTCFPLLATATAPVAALLPCQSSVGDRNPDLPAGSCLCGWETPTFESNLMGQLALSSQAYNGTPVFEDNNVASIAVAAAAALQHCQQSLMHTGRRSRHRRIPPGRVSAIGRRRGTVRSLSTIGLSLPHQLLRPGLSASASNSTGDLSQVKTAGSNSLLWLLGLAGAGKRPSMNHLGTPTSTTSVLGESLASSSVKSGCLTAARRMSQAAARAKLVLASSTGPLQAATGSRISCASSTGSGAESYNSFKLLAEQAGASWRELWRTRMLLMDVLRWAQTAVAAPSTCPSPASPQTALSLDPLMVAALVAATAAASVALQQQQQQQPPSQDAQSLQDSPAPLNASPTNSQALPPLHTLHAAKSFDAQPGSQMQLVMPQICTPYPPGAPQPGPFNQVCGLLHSNAPQTPVSAPVSQWVPLAYQNPPLCLSTAAMSPFQHRLAPIGGAGEPPDLVAEHQRALCGSRRAFGQVVGHLDAANVCAGFVSPHWPHPTPPSADQLMAPAVGSDLRYLEGTEFAVNCGGSPPALYAPGQQAHALICPKEVVFMRQPQPTWEFGQTPITQAPNAPLRNSPQKLSSPIVMAGKFATGCSERTVFPLETGRTAHRFRSRRATGGSSRRRSQLEATARQRSSGTTNDSDAFDSEDDVISVAGERCEPAFVPPRRHADFELTLAAGYPFVGLETDGPGWTYCEPFQRSDHEDDADLSSVSQSASQVVRALSTPPSPQETSSRLPIQATGLGPPTSTSISPSTGDHTA